MFDLTNIKSVQRNLSKRVYRSTASSAIILSLFLFDGNKARGKIFKPPPNNYDALALSFQGRNVILNSTWKASLRKVESVFLFVMATSNDMLP